MNPRSFTTIILLSGCCSCLQTMAQPGTDPNASSDHYPSRRNYFYYTVTLGTGIGVLHAPDNGLLNVSFPYSVDGYDTVFRSASIRPYARSKVFVIPIGAEIGGLHQFINMNASLSVIGKWTKGFNFSFGYGRNFYLDGFKHSSTIEGKAWVIKPSLSISYTRDNGDNSDAILGSINNTGKTINVLGQVANPTFDVTTTSTDDDGNSTSTTSTYNASSLNIAYVQREFALMPKLTISNNPFKKGPHLELTLGYNIPLHERGGISLLQDAGNNNLHYVSHLVDLNHEGITATYNGRRITGAPFVFSGFYLNFTLSFAGH